MSLELGDKCFVIAEAGTCHASSDPEFRFRRAMKYVHAAAEARADAIKFQIFDDPNPKTMFCWIDGDENRAERWRQSKLSFNQWSTIKNEAESCGVSFLASVFEHETVTWLSELNVRATKVASRAAAHLDAFEHAPPPYLVSNGMTKVKPSKGWIVMECEARYPSTAWWIGDFPGFSDHSGNPWRTIDAIVRGCKLIEVHFYTDPRHAGPDRKASLTTNQLALVCEARDAL